MIIKVQRPVLASLSHWWADQTFPSHHFFLTAFQIALLFHSGVSYWNVLPKILLQSLKRWEPWRRGPYFQPLGILLCVCLLKLNNCSLVPHKGTWTSKRPWYLVDPCIPLEEMYLANQLIICSPVGFFSTNANWRFKIIAEPK